MMASLAVGRAPPAAARRPAQTTTSSPRVRGASAVRRVEPSRESAANDAPTTTPSPTSPTGRPAAQAAATALFFLAAAAPAAHAFTPEPANALSLPTWAIHVSSVLEWCAAMGLFVKLAAVRKEPVLAGMAWGMLPLLVRGRR